MLRGCKSLEELTMSKNKDKGGMKSKGGKRGC